MYELKENLSGRKIIIGSLLLLVGFTLLMVYSWAWWGLFVGGAIAWIIIFGATGRESFHFPKKLWVIPLGVLLYFVVGIVFGTLAKALGLHWASSPAVGHLNELILMLPIMLMGEELLGIGILEVARKKGLSLTTSTLISAVIFGLLHVIPYWDGSLFSTLLHVLLLQGVARIIFNFIYLKTGNSIWGSWVAHMLVDIIALFVAQSIMVGMI